MSLHKHFHAAHRLIGKHPSSHCLPILPKTPPPTLLFPNFKTLSSSSLQTNLAPLIIIIIITINRNTPVTSHRRGKINGVAADAIEKLNPPLTTQ